MRRGFAAAALASTLAACSGLLGIDEPTGAADAGADAGAVIDARVGPDAVIELVELGSGFEAGGAPGPIRIGDMDAPTATDVVVLNVAQGQVARLFAQAGQPLLGPSFPSNTPPDPIQLELVDVDADGRLDIVVSASASDVVWYQQTDSGGLDGLASTLSAAGPVAFVVADIDDIGQGLPELLTLSAAGEIGIQHQMTPGQFMPPGGFSACASGGDLVAGAIDADGKADLVVACADGPIRVFLADPMQGSGFVQQPMLTPAFAASRVALLPIDDDEHLDLVALAEASNQALLFVQSPFDAGDFSEAAASPLQLTGTPIDLAVGDLDGDAVADLAVVCNDGNVHLFLHRAGAPFARETLQVPGARGVAIGRVGPANAPPRLLVSTGLVVRVFEPAP